MGFKFDRLVYSGAKRCKQAARVMALALDLDLVPQVDEEFHFKREHDRFFGGDSKLFFAEKAEIDKSGGTVAVAQRMSEYARATRMQILTALFNLARMMGVAKQTMALVLSHMSVAEMGAVDERAMPYCIGEADAVCYTISNGRKIVGSELIKAPKI